MKWVSEEGDIGLAYEAIEWAYERDDRYKWSRRLRDVTDFKKIKCIIKYSHSYTVHTDIAIVMYCTVHTHTYAYILVKKRELIGISDEDKKKAKYIVHNKIKVNIQNKWNRLKRRSMESNRDNRFILLIPSFK